MATAALAVSFLLGPEPRLFGTPPTMCKTPGKQTTKPKLVQHTLAFGSSLRVGGALGRSPLEATVAAVRTALTEAAAESVRAVAEAASEKAIKVKMEPRGCFDPARPVRVQFAPGFGRIRSRSRRRATTTMTTSSFR